MLRWSAPRLSRPLLKLHYYKCLQALKNPEEDMTLNEHIRRIRWQSVFSPLFSLGHCQEGFLSLKGVTDHSYLFRSQVLEIVIVTNKSKQQTPVCFFFNY